MKKSTIAAFKAAGKPFLLQKVAIPPLGTKEILVQNEYTTLCRSDLNTFCGKRNEKVPTILGHEIVGRIAAFGQGAPQTDERGDTLQVGDRISWAIYASNPDSDLAKAGIPQKSADLFKYGHERISADSNLHGGLSEYTILRPNTPVVKIDAQVPLPVATIINCAVATVAGSLRLAGSLKGKKVLILGAGMLGIIACAMSQTQEAEQIVAADINPTRLEFSRAFGTTWQVVADQEMALKVEKKFGSQNPFDLVLEFSGVASAMEQALSLLTIGGTAVWVGATYPQREVQINAETVVRNLLTIKGLHNYNTIDFVKAAAFIEQYHTSFPFENMIHDGFTLQEVNQAFEYGMSQNPFRVGLNISPV